MSVSWKDPKSVIQTMVPWRDYGDAKTMRSRTNDQRAYDSGILAASEFIRRITGDESLSGAVHMLLTPIEEDRNAP